ncbi:MAG: glycosyltransferase 87 family protein [Candidatus Rokuibacteriota bacterium]
MTGRADIDVVIVSWNTREHLARCLTALTAAGDDGVGLNVIVADNGSTDGSAAMVAGKFPHVRLLAGADNVGFGRACNAGARAGCARAILLLNSDCEPAPGALAAMLAALDAGPDVGGVFCRLVNADGTLQPSVHRSLPTPWSHLGDVVFRGSLRHALYRTVALKRWLLAPTQRRHAVAHDVAWGGAACLLVRRAAFEGVGGFDERFFMYSEDLDLCARLGAAGHRLRYLPEAAAMHAWGASTAQRPAAMVREAYVSRVRYFDKHFPGWGGAVAATLATVELGVRRATFSVLGRLPGADRAGWRRRAAESAACAASVAPALGGGARAVAVLLALVVALGVARYVNELARLAADALFIDFAHYYTYATLVAQRANPFEADAIARVDAALGLRRAGADANYPPVFYLLMQPWILLPFKASALAWLAAAQVAVGASIVLAMRRVPAAHPAAVAAAALVALNYQPLTESLAVGQANWVLLLLLTVAWWAVRTARPWTAALALGVAVHVKPQFAVMIPLLWWVGQGAVAARAAAVAGAAAGAGVALLGWRHHADYLAYVWAMPAYLHAWSENISLHATLHRVLDGAVGRRAVEALALGAAAVVVVILGRALPRAVTPSAPAFDWAWGLGLAAVLLLSPLAEEHHLVVLLLPITLLLLRVEGCRGWTASVLVMSVLLIAARYSLARFPALHAGAGALLMMGKIAGVAGLAYVLARRLREEERA